MGKFRELFMTHLRMVTRNRVALFFSLLFPLIFVGIMGIAFQEGDPGNTTIDIGLINNDSGIPTNAIVFGEDGTPVTGSTLSENYIEILKSLEFDSGTPIFDISQYDQHPPDALERRDIKALITIPQDFSKAIMAVMRDSFNMSIETQDWQEYPSTNFTTDMQIDGDPTLLEFTVASSIIEDVTKQYVSLGQQSAGITIRISAQDTEGFSIFDYTVPGLVIFAIISNASTVATVALADVEFDRLDRLRLTKIRPWQYTTALILSQQLVAMIQIPIMFGAAILFGFPITIGILYAFVFAFFVSAAITGIGIMLAGIVTDSTAVGGLSAIVTTPMAFLAGAFFPIPNPTIISEGGILGDRTLGIFDLLPPRKAIDALRLLLIEDYSFTDVWFELALTIVLAVLYLGIGIMLYNRKHLQLK